MYYILALLLCFIIDLSAVASTVDIPLPYQVSGTFSGDSEQTQSFSGGLSIPLRNAVLLGLGAEYTRQDLEGQQQTTQGGNVSIAGNPFSHFGWEVLAGGWNVGQDIDASYSEVRAGYQGYPWSIFLGYRGQTTSFETINVASVRVETDGWFYSIDIGYTEKNWAMNLTCEVGEFEDSLTGLNNDLAYLIVPEAVLSVFPSFSIRQTQLGYDYFFSNWSLGTSISTSTSAMTGEDFQSLELRGSYEVIKNTDLLASLGTAMTLESDEEESPYTFFSLGFNHRY